MADNITVPKGLAGVITDDTSVSKVMAETNSLTYRGYAVQDLCEKCSWEEVAYLMVNGELPLSTELNDFVVKERGYRNISNDLLEVIQKFPKDAHPMDSLRTGVFFRYGRSKNMGMILLTLTWISILICWLRFLPSLLQLLDIKKEKNLLLQKKFNIF